MSMFDALRNAGSLEEIRIPPPHRRRRWRLAVLGLVIAGLGLLVLA